MTTKPIAPAAGCVEDVATRFDDNGAVHLSAVVLRNPLPLVADSNAQVPNEGITYRVGGVLRWGFAVPTTRHGLMVRPVLGGWVIDAAIGSKPTARYSKLPGRYKSRSAAVKAAKELWRDADTAAERSLAVHDSGESAAALAKLGVESLDGFSVRRAPRS